MKKLFFMSMCAVVALSACSSSSSQEESGADSSAVEQPVSDSAATVNTDSVTDDNDPWLAVCEAAYEVDMGNASSQDADVWIDDCKSECALPDFEQQCLEMAQVLEVDVKS